MAAPVVGHLQVYNRGLVAALVKAGAATAASSSSTKTLPIVRTASGEKLLDGSTVPPTLLPQVVRPCLQRNHSSFVFTPRPLAPTGSRSLINTR